MHFKIPYLKLFFLPALILFMFIPFAAAQPSDFAGSLLIAQNQPVGEVDLKEANREALEKLRRMTPEEIDALDKKLEEALMLYYERKFATALPIFKEIADQVETMDVMFWIGSSAMQMGENQLAIEKFKKMLEIDPQLHRARLELAMTYFRMGRYKEARRELEVVQAASPPPAVQQKITKLFSTIDERSKKLFYNLRASLGYLWDDNISFGPERKGYDVPGTTVTPTITDSKLSDEAWIANAAGNALYDIGESRGMMWNTTFSVYSKNYSDYSQFNYLAVDVTTGPWWSRPRDIFKLPFGYLQNEFGSERLAYSFHFDPNYEYFFNQYISLKGLYSYRNENYFQDVLSGLGLDNENHRFELTPSFYFNNRMHTISVTAGYEDHNAEIDRFSYADPYFTCSYFVRFATDTELFFRYQLTLREYEGKDNNYNLERDEERHSYTAVVSQGFYKNFFASLAFGYYENDSNFELYDYDKTTYTISIGARF